ncbi:DegT/DnrJ/EryC1/StrS family aminotransferase [Parabacteroides distasonis]|nr:DegT/DnrJ/EryC1/StrS family aminotransferase [Parabacteroides distasonis]
MNKRIYLCLAHMSGKEQMYIKEAFDTNRVVPLGPNVNGFEKDLEEFVGEGKHVVALSAGTAAVHLALLACGVKPGDEVLVQSFTFCASSHPITYLGGYACVRGLGGGYLEYGSCVVGRGDSRSYREDGKNTESDCPGGLIWDAL